MSFIKNSEQQLSLKVTIRIINLIKETIANKTLH